MCYLSVLRCLWSWGTLGIETYGVVLVPVTLVSIQAARAAMLELGRGFCLSVTKTAMAMMITMTAASTMRMVQVLPSSFEKVQPSEIL